MIEAQFERTDTSKSEAEGLVETPQETTYKSPPNPINSNPVEETLKITQIQDQLKKVNENKFSTLDEVEDSPVMIDTQVSEPNFSLLEKWQLRNIDKSFEEIYRNYDSSFDFLAQKKQRSITQNLNRNMALINKALVSSKYSHSLLKGLGEISLAHDNTEAATLAQKILIENLPVIDRFLDGKNQPHLRLSAIAALTRVVENQQVDSAELIPFLFKHMRADVTDNYAQEIYQRSLQAIMIHGTNDDKKQMGDLPAIPH